MKFSCTRSELQTAVSIAAKAASAKSPIPALEGILIETTMNGIRDTYEPMVERSYELMLEILSAERYEKISA